MERRQQQFHALGSEAFITLIAGSGHDFDEMFARLHEQITAFERRFSRFLPNSELTIFNKQAGSDVAVSEPFRRLLLASQQMTEATSGLYNPFILPALQKAGYKGSWPSPENLAGAQDFSDRQVVAYTELQVSDKTARIPVGAALDFGGIGKGYLLDELSAFLEPLQLHGYWVSLGGDIVCSGHDLEGEWSVQVQHATMPEAAVATLKNESGQPLFIATSGITKRRGETANGPWHHIINPQTGQPARTDMLTATVASDSGMQADVYAKIIIIGGADQAQKLKQSERIRSYILQYSNKEPAIVL